MHLYDFCFSKFPSWISSRHCVTKLVYLLNLAWYCDFSKIHNICWVVHFSKIKIYNVSFVPCSSLESGDFKREKSLIFLTNLNNKYCEFCPLFFFVIRTLSICNMQIYIYIKLIVIHGIHRDFADLQEAHLKMKNEEYIWA